jgi:hypothetical protein
VADHEIAHEFWRAALRDPKDVVQHQDLPVDLRSRTDADDRHLQRIGHGFAQLVWHALQ